MELQFINSSSQKKKEFVQPLQANPQKYSLISKIFFLWIHPLLFIDSRIKLRNEDTLPLFDSERVINEKLTNSLKKYKVFTAICHANMSTLLQTFFYNISRLLLEFKNPIYMQLLLEYLDSNEKSSQYGILLAVSFTILTINPIIQTQISLRLEVTDIRIRNSLYNVIYNKTLQCTNLPEGLGINLLQVDLDTVKSFMRDLPLMPMIPLEFLISSYIIYQQVGYAVLVAYGTIITVMIGNLLFGSTCKKSNEKLMKIRDKRIEESSQLLSEIKMIKAYNWQHYFSKRINQIRKKELGKLRFLNILRAINSFFFWALPSVTVVSVLLYYTLGMNQELNSQKAFVTLTTISSLAIPLLIVPGLFNHFIQLQVSQKRIQTLLDSKPWVQLSNSGFISLANCSFAYGPKVVLKEITLKIQPHEFLAVIGQVGSGKSSLLLSLMGETQLITGEFFANTDISYAPSMDSWIINGTLKQNILMGREFREEWYWKVVDACSLVDDFQALAAGDATEIGERGINLSGGQKARVCLARAVYADKEVLLMDDPLSSVDNKVADSIFSKCFEELLKDKVRVLVTHRHCYLDRVQRVIEMKEGRIVKSMYIEEDYEILSSSDPSPSFDRIDEKSIPNTTSSQVPELNLSEDHQKENPSTSNKPPQSSTDAKSLIIAEDRDVDAVSTSVYKSYISWSGGPSILLLGTLLILLWLLSEMLGDITLKDWSSTPSQSSHYIPLFLTLRLSSSIFMFFRYLIFDALITITASFSSHKLLLSSLIHAPINLFYDITPAGRILNRLSKDMNTIDEHVGRTWGTCITNAFTCVGCMAMGLLYFPYLFLIVPLVVFPSRYISKIYINSARELTRLESISRSPILSHFQESLEGVKHIRVFNQSENFIKKNQEIIDMNCRINYSLTGCRLWMRLHSELVSALLMIALFCMAVGFSDEVSAGTVGLCMAYLIPLPSEVNQLISNLTNLENGMVSVERVKKFTEIPAEQPLVVQYDQKQQQWPSSPSIRFRKVCMRYRPGTELVLKDVSFELLAGTRAGIVGRTGSGKSSLFLALLRIVELERGVITIDGVNIALIGLEKLREGIRIIPQEPLVFNGSMRDNLDPRGRHGREEIEKALDEVGMRFGLDFQIRNGGGNLSVGERQLVSLCRAMICSARVVLFDEATAGIDPDSDSMIQDVIKNKFSGCTVITIAHRTNTIQNSDLILVMDDGKISEVKLPNEKGEFSFIGSNL